MNEQEIRRCRFCKASSVPFIDAWGRSRFLCGRAFHCGFRGPWRDTREGAIAAWNEVNTPAAEREEGVVAWMETGWRKGGWCRCVVTAICDHPDFTERVRIIPEPEPLPRYVVKGWNGGAKVVDAHEGWWARAYFDSSHPYPWAAAHAEAERLNQREHEQRGGAE